MLNSTTIIRPRRYRLALLPALLVLVLGLAGCGRRAADRDAGGENAPEHRLTVVTTLFPLYDWARQIGGPEARVTLILPPGQEAHTFEPTASDVLTVSRADLFVYVGDFMEPWAGDFIQGAANPDLRVVVASKGVQLLDADQEHVEPETGDHDGHDHAGHDHAGVDPHIWLDPIRAQQMVRNIADAFAAADPSHAALYQQRADAYTAKLAELDARFKAMLPTCKCQTILYAGHFTFGYFAHRYGIAYVSPYRGFSPDAEPTPRDIIDMVDTIKKLNATVIFHEELLKPKVARVLAEETGARMLVLSGAHNVSKDDLDAGVTFLQIMNTDYDHLKQGLQCP